MTLVRTTRRGAFAASREIVRAAEEIADGRYDRLPVLAEDDPLAPVATALDRIATSVRTRSAELERRLGMLEGILGAARETAVLLLDSDGDIRFGSAGAEIMFGWGSCEWAGKNVSAIFPPEAYGPFVAKLARRSLKEEPLSQQIELIGRGGLRFPGSLRLGAFAALPGGGEGWILEVRDVRAEDSLRAQLHDAEQQHRTLVEGLPIGVLVVQQGRIVYGNAALGETLGLRDGAAGRDFRECLAAEDLLQVLDRLRRSESGEEPSFTID